MGGELSLDKYCTAALPIEKNHTTDAKAGEANELLHEDAQKKFKDDVSSPKTTSRRSDSGSSKSKKSKYSAIYPSDDDEFDDAEHVDDINDTLKLPSTSNSNKPRPRSKTYGKKKRDSKKDNKSRRSRGRNRRNTDPARSPSPSTHGISGRLQMSSRPSVSILIPRNETDEPPKLSLLSSMSPKTSKSSKSSNGSIGSLRKYQNHSMTPTGRGTVTGFKRHSYHYRGHSKSKSKSRRGRISLKSRSRADTHNQLHEELEEYEIQSKQDKHEKDILKAEIMRLRMELAKIQQVTHNMAYQRPSYHGHGPYKPSHKVTSSGPAFTFQTQVHPPKVLRMATEPVPKFTDHENADIQDPEFDDDRDDDIKKGSSYPPTELVDDVNDSELPITPSKTSYSPSHSRSVSRSNSNKIEVTPQSVLSPLSPLSENMQNIILAFPATFPEVDQNGNGTNK